MTAGHRTVSVTDGRIQHRRRVHQRHDKSSLYQKLHLLLFPRSRITIAYGIICRNVCGTDVQTILDQELIAYIAAHLVIVVVVIVVVVVVVVVLLLLHNTANY